MPLLKTFNNLLNRTKILKTQHIHIRHGRTQHFLSQGCPPFIAVSQNQMILVISAYGTVRHLVIMGRQIKQFPFTRFCLEQIGVKNGRFRLGPPRMNPRGTIGIKIPNQLGVIGHTRTFIARHIIAPRFKFGTAQIGQLRFKIPLV